MASWFEYSITRPFTLRRFTPILLVSGTLWVSFVTLVGIAAVGYETVPAQFTPSEFNTSNPIWYEKILPTSEWIPPSQACEGSKIKLRDSSVQLFPDLSV